MSDLSPEALRALAHLCRLELSEGELAQFYKDTQRILTYIEHFQTLEALPLPDAHLEKSLCPLRDDHVDPACCIAQQQFLANAPAHLGGMIRILPVLHDVSSER